MKIILMGALGRMGRYVNEELIKQGHHVIPVDIGYKTIDKEPIDDEEGRRISEEKCRCKCGENGSCRGKCELNCAAHADGGERQNIGCEGKGYWRVEDVIEEADALVDFSNHSAIFDILGYATRHRLPLVIASTGHTEKEREAIEEATKHIPIFFCGNMSYGIRLFRSLVGKVAAAFKYADVEIVEAHHRFKADAPSGTAIMLAEEIIKARGEGQMIFGERKPLKRGDVYISSLRMGGIVGEHCVSFDTGLQRFTLVHSAHTRSLYAVGAVNALKYVTTKECGLFSTDDLFD